MNPKYLIKDTYTSHPTDVSGDVLLSRGLEEV